MGKSGAMGNLVQLVFRDVADLSASERERYFEERQVPADLRHEVESLLRFDVTGAGSLTERVAQSAEQFLNAKSGAREGGRCGPYRLVRLLGEGGMGTVFLAERMDGEVEQRVAIKFVRNVPQALSMRDRFLRERQILASLSHPGIARLFDAGHTPEGQPYLVMEYIEGTPIDVYSADLDLRGKLSLFLRITDAVSYAHRNLVIHRDLKPANILVDAGGQPKLLDFGIAKILDEAADRELTRERLLTPDYASPEQVRGAAQTTATDVYSLGAVLYRLLTGRSPHIPSGERPESVEVMICVTEPAAPSRLNASLPRDLDYILGKALRKQPEERYASVDALAADIRAFLDARPVAARSGSAWYHTRKFMRRHWLPVTAVWAAIVCLSAGMYVANRERAIALHRFGQLRQLANRMLHFDAAIRGLPGSTKARQEIVSASMDYLEGLGREARNDTDLAMDLADGYQLLAEAQGVPPNPNLGQFAAAGESLRRAEVFIKRVLAATPSRPDALLLAAEIEQDRMILASTEQRDGDVLAAGRECAMRLDALIESRRASPDQAKDAARIYVNVGQANMNAHRFEDAARYVRRGIELSRSASPAPEYRAVALSLLANVLRYTGDLDGALQSITEARSLAERIRFPDGQQQAMTLYPILLRQGWILGEDEDSIGLGRPAEAVEPLRKAFDLVERQAAKDPNDAAMRDRVSTVGRLLGDNLRYLDPAQALAVYDRAVGRAREVKDNVRARREEALLLARSSYVLDGLHRSQEAGARIDSALELLRATGDYPAAKIVLGETTHQVIRALADHEAETSRTERAIEVYRELLDKAMATTPNPDRDLRQANDLSQIYQALARLYRKAGERGAAGSMEYRAVELWRGWNLRLPDNPFVQRRLSAGLGESR